MSPIALVKSAMGAPRDVVLATAGSFAMRIAGLASTFALGVLLARVLGPADYGLYGLITTISLLMVTVVHLGTPQLAVRELSVRSARGDSAGIRWIVHRFLLVTTLAAILLSSAAVLIAVFVYGGGGRDLALVTLGALFTPLTSITVLIAAQLRGLGAMFQGQFLDVAGRPAMVLLAALVVLLLGFKLDAVVALWLQIAVTAIGVIISAAWLLRAMPKAPPDGATAEPIPWLRSGLPLGAVDVLRHLDGAYGVVLMGWLASDTELGVFRVAIACGVLLSMPATVLHIVLAPRIAELYSLGQRDELQRVLSGASLALVAAMIPATLLIILVGQPLVNFLFGDAYAGSWVPLIYIAVAQTLVGLFGMGPVLLAMADSEAHLIKIYLVSVGAGIACAIPLVHAFGAAGAAMAQIVSAGAIGLFSWRFARKQLGLELTFLKLHR